MSGVELIPASTALERHDELWRELAVARGNAFITPEWFRAWRELYDPDDAALVAVVRGVDQEPLGLIPLAFERSGGMTLIRIAGANLADRLHPVAGEDDETAVAVAVIGELLERRSDWDAIVLDNVDLDASWWRFAGRSARRLRTRIRPGTDLPFTRLDGLDWEGYLANRSSSFRKRMRQIERAIEREAGGSAVVQLASDPGAVTERLDWFFEHHHRRLDQRGGSSLRGPRAASFHQRFAELALERGWLRLWTLEAEGRSRIAVWYGWMIGDRYGFYQGTFDERWSRHSPGLYLDALVIGEAIGEGANEFDMLLGDEEYKLRLVDDRRRSATVTLTRSWSLGGLLIGLEAAARGFAATLPDAGRRRIASALGPLIRRLPTGRRR